LPANETPRSKLRGISTKDISYNNAASSGVFTLRENKNKSLPQDNYPYEGLKLALSEKPHSLEFTPLEVYIYGKNCIFKCNHSGCNKSSTTMC
jgi:hypothetical protein